MKLGIVDYGVGNIYSLRKALEQIGADTIVSGEAKILDSCSGIILPGVGAFGDAYSNMAGKGLDNIILEQAAKGKMILGICLGMQLLFEYSTEDNVCRGLGLLKGWVDKIPGTVKVPHMGWNSIEIKRSSRVLNGIENGDYVYFVHSYYAKAGQNSDICAYSSYGVDIPAVAARDNIFGMQFHPEKSGKTGLKILNNFKEMVI
ncbi:MAG: imidazole glycerol phosphate synthase subunit HisH [Caulobacteraceae bacterium]